MTFTHPGGKFTFDHADEDLENLKDGVRWYLSRFEKAKDLDVENIQVKSCVMGTTGIEEITLIVKLIHSPRHGLPDPYRFEVTASDFSKAFVHIAYQIDSIMDSMIPERWDAWV